jgi:hypothetical protein
VLGLFTSLDSSNQLSIFEYYSRLPDGLFTILTTKLGWPLIMAAIILNIFIVRRMKDNEVKKQMIKFFIWILIFILIYLALLPLGGYRWYRPNAIRYDTFLPVTLACIFIFARSSYYLLNQLKSKRKLIYALFIIAFVLLFSVNDNSNFRANSCEIGQLKRLASSSENPVELHDTCTLMSWEIIRDAADSELQGELIYHWNITSEKKTFYQVTFENN